MGQTTMPRIIPWICEEPGCTKGAKSGGKCKKHGGGRRCQFENQDGKCTKSAVGGGYNPWTFCKRHGGGLKCVVEGCTHSVASGSDKCITHGGKPCSEPGCTRGASIGGKCIKHGGGHRCQIESCTRAANRGTFCIKHGGGRRCQSEGCSNCAQSGFDFCGKHGGGKRCSNENCDSLAVSGRDRCIRHGGKTCSHPGCKNGSAKKGLCRRHGGGKPCSKPGCSTESRGGYEFCARHGGGLRCESEACAVYETIERSLAVKVSPTGERLCCWCYRAQYPELQQFQIRREQFLLAEIQRQIPEMEKYFLTWDCKLENQTCNTYKPDMCWSVKNTLLHIEIDETLSHEDNDERLVDIHNASGLKYHVCIRINCGSHRKQDPMMKRMKTSKNNEYLYVKNKQEWDTRMGVIIQEVRDSFQSCFSDNESEIRTGKRKLFFD